MVGRMHPVVVGESVAELFQHSYCRNSLFVDVAHVDGSEIFIQRRRGYAVRFAAAAIPTRLRLPQLRSRKDNSLQLLCAEGLEAFQPLSVAIRNLSSWTGGPEGELGRLHLPYRVILGRAELRDHLVARESAPAGERC